jgi:hypothetical protein
VGEGRCEEVRWTFVEVVWESRVWTGGNGRTRGKRQYCKEEKEDWAAVRSARKV